jgi:hypothetical protein
MGMDLSQVAKELGKRGGLKTKENKGLDHYRKMKQLSDEAKKRKKMIQKDLVDNR